MHELIKELRDLQIRTTQVTSRLNKFLRDRAKLNKEFDEGELVNVFDERDILVCEGIVGICYILPFESFEYNKFAESEEKYLERINEIRYKVYAVKKNGEVSKNNAINSNSLSATKSYGSHYIQKK